MGVYQFEQFLFDVDSGTLKNADGKVHLRPRTFDLLRILIEEHPRLVTRDELFDRVWKTEHISDGALSQAMSELRTALGGGSKAANIIETCYRRGYRFKAAVSKTAKEQQLSSKQSKAEFTRPKALISLRGAVVVLSLIACTLALWQYHKQIKGSNPDDPPAAQSYRAGAEHLKACEYSEALSHLQATIETKASCQRAHKALARIWMSLGDFQQATIEAQKAAALTTGGTSERLEIEAILAESRDDWEQAAHCYSKIKEQHPDNFENSLLYFYALLNSRQFRKAEHELKMLKGADQPNELARVRLKLAETRLFGAEGSIKNYRSAAKDTVFLAQKYKKMGVLAEAFDERAQSLAVFRFTEGARRSSDEARFLYQDQTNQWRIALTYLSDAKQLIREGLFDEAQSCLNRAGELFGQLESQRGEIALLMTWAYLHHQQNESETALQRLYDATTICKLIDYQPGCAAVLLQEAQIHAQLGEIDNAIMKARDAAETYESIGNRFGQAESLKALAEYIFFDGQPSESAAIVSRTLTILNELGDSVLTAQALELQAKVQVCIGQLEKSKKSIHRAILQFEQLDQEDQIIRSRYLLREIYLEEGDTFAADRQSDLIESLTQGSGEKLAKTKTLHKRLAPIDYPMAGWTAGSELPS